MGITTYRPKKKKRKRTHGFIRRSETASGKKILKKRRVKKRTRLTV